jgi:creatinine amidohydrolase/Fe(II)-dependent formamide hydrolase-like protein
VGQPNSYKAVGSRVDAEKHIADDKAATGLAAAVEIV